MIGTILFYLLIAGLIICAVFLLQFALRVPILHFQPKLSDCVKRGNEVKELTFKVKTTLLGKLIHGKNEEYLNYVKDTGSSWRDKESGDLVNVDDYPFTRQKLDAIEFKIINDKRYE